MGERLPSCDTDSVSVERLEALPEKLRELLTPLVEEVESLTEKTRQADQKLEQIARTEYPETRFLRQVSGVGPLIALTFVLTLEDRHAQTRTHRPVGERPTGAKRLRPRSWGGAVARKPGGGALRQHAQKGVCATHQVAMCSERRRSLVTRISGG
jgi:transposase